MSMGSDDTTGCVSKNAASVVIDRLIDSFPSVIPDINGCGMGRFDPIHGIVISVFRGSVISRSILSIFPLRRIYRYRGNRLTPDSATLASLGNKSVGIGANGSRAQRNVVVGVE